MNAMSTSTARRGRPPKGESRLSREAIVQATLRVIDAEGVSAVSMRAVGRVLGVDAKSLYNHVDGKDGLLDAVAEHILGS
ncbi:MAG: TetR family transcriptional regulator, partial [Saccharothrix sp.]|nr:TetR family transcriptional regulator [Saccharothrix sp.]